MSTTTLINQTATILAKNITDGYIPMSLMNEIVNNEAKIDAIKAEVAEEYDNISNPIPLFVHGESVPVVLMTQDV